MRRIFVITCVLATALVGLMYIPSTFASPPVTFSGGSGSANDPYQISRCADFYSIQYELTSYFVLTTDLTCASFPAGPSSFDGVSPESAPQFHPIGSTDPFEGNFDGQEHSISGTTIEWDGNTNIGLFAQIGDDGIVKNLNLYNFSIIADDINSGVLAGQSSGTISNVHVSGTVIGTDYAAGLVGNVFGGTISQSSADVTVDASDMSGGFAGSVADAQISQSYATDDVSGDDRVGGFAGYLAAGGSIDNSYARGFAEGSDQVAGFVGRNEGTITDSYSTGEAQAGNHMGGFTAYGSGTVSNSFWDTDTSDQSNTYQGKGTGKTTGEMTATSTFTEAGWDFTSIWDRQDDRNDGYPVLRWLDPANASNDINGDGINDVGQENVIGITSGLTNKAIGIEINDGCEYDDTRITPESNLTTQDVAFDYKEGLLSFTTSTCGASGFTLHVKLFYYGLDNSTVVLRKYSPSTGAFTTVPSSSVTTQDIYSNQVVVASYDVVDGGPFDSDGTADGKVTDPVGLATAVLGAPQTGLGGTAN